MIDIKLKYQAAIFLNAEDIGPSPDVITALIDMFSDKKLIPNTFQQVGRAAPVTLTRLRLADVTNEWSIAFATHRIDIDKSQTDPKGINVGEVAAFCSDANNMFDRILKKFNKQANRMTLNTHVLLEEMAIPKLENIYNKLFQPTKFYKDYPPFEWDWRSVSHLPIDILELSEDLNVITIIKRVGGDLSSQSGITKIDRIQLSPDINTLPQNTNYRFGITHVTDFLNKACDTHGRLLADIEEYIND